MIKQKSLSILLTCAVLLLVPLISAVPGIPHQFYGSVKVNGEPTADNNILVAVVEGDYYTTVTTDGMYGMNPNIFYVEDPNGNRCTGESCAIISFYLGDKYVGEFEFINNGFTNFDIETTTACGDSYCLGQETCESCPTDCGICMDPPTIDILSPERRVYEESKIDLVVQADQPIIVWMYSLDQNNFVTFNPNITLDVGEGEHNITVLGINPSFQSGSSTVSFSVEIPVDYCGDGVCNNGETCSTCATDCGSCNTGSSSSGPGGGPSSSSGGGGGIITKNDTNSTIVPLVYEEESNIDIDEEKQDENGNEGEGQEETVEQSAGFFSSITGAAVIIGEQLGIFKSIIAIVFVLVIIIAMVMIMKRRVKEKQ